MHLVFIMQLNLSKCNGNGRLLVLYISSKPYQMNYKDFIYAAKSLDRKSAVREELMPSQHPLIKPTKDITASNRSYPLVKEDLNGLLAASDGGLVLSEKQAERYQYQKQANIAYSRQFKMLSKLLGNQTMQFDELRHKIQNMILQDVPTNHESVLLEKIQILERQLAEKHPNLAVNGKASYNLSRNSNSQYVGTNSATGHQLGELVQGQTSQHTYNNLRTEIKEKSRRIKQIEEIAQDNISKSEAHIRVLEEELVKRNQTIQKLTFQLDTIKRKSQANLQELQRLRKRQREWSSLESESRVTYKGMNYSINSLLLQLQARDSQMGESLHVQQQLQFQLQKVKTQNANLREELKNSQSMVQEINKRVNQQFQRQVEKLKQQVGQLRQHNQQMVRNLQDRQAQVQQLKTAKQSQSQQIAKLSAQIEQAKATVLQYQAKQSQSLHNDKNEAQKDKSYFVSQQDYQQQISSYQQQIANLTAKYQQSNQRENKYQRNLEIYQQQLSRIASHKSQFDAIINQIHSKIGVDNNYQHHSTNQQNELQLQINQFQAQKNQMLAVINQKDDLIKQLELQMRQLKELLNQKQQLGEEVQRRDDLIKQLGEHRNRERINYETQYNDMRTVINELQKQIQNKIDKQLSSVRESLRILQQNDAKLRIQNAQLQQINQQLTAKIQQLQNQFEQQRKQSEDKAKQNYQNEKQEWMSQMQRKDQQLQKMIREKQQVVQLMEELQVQKQTLKSQIYKQQNVQMDEQAVTPNKGLASEDKIINLSYSNAQNTPKLLASYLQQNSRMQRQLQMVKSQKDQLSEQIQLQINQIQNLKEKINIQIGIINDFQSYKVQTEIYMKQKQDQIKAYVDKMSSSQNELSSWQKKQTEENVLRQQMAETVQKLHSSERERMIIQQQLQQTQEELRRCRQQYERLRQDLMLNQQTIAKYKEEIQKYRLQNQQLNSVMFTFAKKNNQNKVEQDINIVQKSKGGSLLEAPNQSDKAGVQALQIISSLSRNILKETQKMGYQGSRQHPAPSNSSNNQLSEASADKKSNQRQQINEEQQDANKKQKSSSAYQIKQNQEAERQRIYSQNIGTDLQKQKTIVGDQVKRVDKLSSQNYLERYLQQNLVGRNSSGQEAQISTGSLTKNNKMDEEDNKYEHIFGKFQAISTKQASYLPHSSNKNKNISQDVKDSIKEPSVSEYYQQHSKSNFYGAMFMGITTHVPISRPSILQQQMTIQRRDNSSRSQSHSKSKVNISYGFPNKLPHIKIVQGSTKQRQQSEISNNMSGNRNATNQSSVYHINSIPPPQNSNKNHKPSLLQTPIFQKRSTLINKLGSPISSVTQNIKIQQKQKALPINNSAKQLPIINNIRENGSETIRLASPNDGTWKRQQNQNAYFSPKVVSSYSPKQRNLVFNSMASTAKDKPSVLPVPKLQNQAVIAVQTKRQSGEGTKKVQMRSVMSGKRSSAINETPSFGVSTPLKKDGLQNDSMSQSQDSGIQVLQYDWKAPCCRNV